MGKVVFDMSISLDGFIAGPKDDENPDRSMLTLDGVIQAPGDPEEDPTGGFRYCGWTVPYVDEFVGRTMEEQMSGSSDFLLG